MADEMNQQSPSGIEETENQEVEEIEIEIIVEDSDPEAIADEVLNQEGAVLDDILHPPVAEVIAPEVEPEAAPIVEGIIEQPLLPVVEDIRHPPGIVAAVDDVRVPLLVPALVEGVRGRRAAPAAPVGRRLRNLLEQTRGGQYILLQPRLTNANRSWLAAYIADYMINNSQNQRSLRTNLQFWSREIVALFPFESFDGWYTPYQAGPPRLPATGRLYNRYTAVRRRLRLVLAEPTARIAPQQTENDRDLLDQLHSVSFDAFKRIEELWRLTFDVRNRGNTIAEYYSHYPQLRTPIAPTLLAADYERLEQPNSNALKSKCPLLSSQLLQIAAARPACRAILQSTENVPEEVRAFIILPYLFRPRQIPGLKGWKPSAREQCNGFIQHVNAARDLDAAIAAREQLMLTHHLTCQPIVFVVGNLEQLTAAYLVINRVKYIFDNVLNAMDACFKSYFALNAQYPLECEQTWAFLERYVYEITAQLRSNRNFVGVSSLISDLTALNNPVGA